MKKTTPTYTNHAKPYIFGFVLSVCYTSVPYILVTQNVLSGTALLITILTFAFLQMIIQLVFFLHLGRGPKPLYNVVFLFSTAGIIFLVIAGSLFIMSHLRYNMTPEELIKRQAQDEKLHQVEGTITGACENTRKNHQVVINDEKANPILIEANLCDTITFITKDDEKHLMAFGTHADHETYAGNDELPLKKGKNVTFTLNTAGSYRFHDHYNPMIYGYFQVSESMSQRY